MRAARCPSLLLLAPAAALVLLGGDAKAASPAAGAISSTSGPISWAYGPVVSGTLVDTGVEDVCPPGPCDNFDLTLSLPQPAATFYQANTATLTIHYTWTSSVPTDLDVFAFSPTGAKYGPGSPDDTSTGSGVEDLSITDPPNGVWHVRSVAALAPIPTGARPGPTSGRRSRASPSTRSFSPTARPAARSPRSSTAPAARPLSPTMTARRGSRARAAALRPDPITRPSAAVRMPRPRRRCAPHTRTPSTIARN